jgi:hypothetical protein
MIFLWQNSLSIWKNLNKQVDKMKRSDSDKSKKPQHQQTTNMIWGYVNDEQHDMDDNEDINDPKEIKACSMCGKNHRGHCWHRNKKVK